METENEILHSNNNQPDGGDRGGGSSGGWFTVVTWIKSWWPEKSAKLGEPNPKQKIAELIMCELTWQMKLAEQRRLEKEKEEKIQKSGVDYSWLVTNKPKFQTIPEFKKLELEDLCYRLDPDDCTQVIRSIWKSCQNEPNASELPNIVQTILTNQIQEKQLKECSSNNTYNPTINLSTLALGEWSRWVSSSVTNLFSSQGGPERTSRANSQELNSINSLEMVEMGVEPVDV